MHLLPLDLRLEYRGQAFLPKELVADFPEEPRSLPFAVPSAVQELPSYVVFFFPGADAGNKGFPLLLAGHHLLLQCISILPNIFEKKLSHVLGHVLGGYLGLRRNLLLLYGRFVGSAQQVLGLSFGLFEAAQIVKADLAVGKLVLGVFKCVHVGRVGRSGLLSEVVIGLADFWLVLEVALGLSPPEGEDVVERVFEAALLIIALNEPLVVRLLLREGEVFEGEGLQLCKSFGVDDLQARHFLIFRWPFIAH